jgi:hypothetical protein
MKPRSHPDLRLQPSRCPFSRTPPGSPRLISCCIARAQTGFMYLQAIFVSTFYRTYPHTLKYILTFGTVMGAVGLIGSAFATKVRRPPLLGSGHSNF